MMAESLGPHRGSPPLGDGMAAVRVVFPTSEEEFKEDVRVSFDKLNGKWVLEEDGDEWEWNEKIRKWIPSLDEALIQRQQEIYKVEGVDEDANTAAENNKKRKAELKIESDNKKAKKEPRERPKTAIYVTGIPIDASFDEINDLFKKYGLIEEDIHTSLPKIKMYANDDGVFKGDARIIYFKEPSVALAIQMLDKTDFRNSGHGSMRVQVADFSLSKSAQQKEVSVEHIKKHRSRAERAAAIKKTTEMNNRLADWDDDDVSALPPPNPTKYQRQVVLKQMFRLHELEEDPSAILDIKEDIREEASKYGTVTNTILYDLEPSGIVKVQFKEAESAARCAAAFNGRVFAERHIIAYVPEKNEQYRQSDKHGEPSGLRGLDEDSDHDENGAYDEPELGKDASLEGHRLVQAMHTEEKGNNVDGGLKTMAPAIEDEKRRAL